MLNNMPRDPRKSFTFVPPVDSCRELDVFWGNPSDAVVVMLTPQQLLGGVVVTVHGSNELVVQQVSEVVHLDNKQYSSFSSTYLGKLLKPDRNI